jgi:hypothetical protein
MKTLFIAFESRTGIRLKKSVFCSLLLKLLSSIISAH